MALDRAIADHLRARGVPFTTVTHDPVVSVEHAAQMRGLPSSQAAKAILVKARTGFAVVAVRACDVLDSARVRHALGSGRLRFASPDELLAITGCTPLAVPPVGRPLIDADLWFDATLAAVDRIAFTPGRHDLSFVVAGADLVGALGPRVASLRAQVDSA